MTLRTVICVLAVLAAHPLKADDTSPVQTAVVDDDTFVAISSISEASINVLSVIQNYELVGSLAGYALDYGTKQEGTAPGTDITGSGGRELLITEFSGGAHCCFTYYLYAFDPSFHLLAKLDTADAGASFKNLDGKPGFEVVTADLTFAYWKTYYAASPKPRVVLDWNGSDYVPSPTLMAAPAPSAGTLQAEAVKVASSDMWTASDLNPALWREMLDLIYTGHADLAWAFFEEAWPQGREGQDAFLKDFKCQLATSPYWDTVAGMNGLVPDRSPDCPDDTAS